MSLFTELRKLATDQPEEDAHRLARGFLASKPQDTLESLVADTIREMQRDATRECERSTFLNVQELLAGSTSVRAVNVAVLPNVRDEFRQLWGRRFSLGGGVNIQWEQATIAEHEARIAYMTMMRERYDATVEQDIEAHRQAIAVCRAAKVERLSELPEAAVVA